MIDLGYILMQMRKDRGLTQAQLAELTGDRQNNISWLERGKRNVTFERFLRIADILQYEVVLEVNDPVDYATSIHLTKAVHFNSKKK